MQPGAELGCGGSRRTGDKGDISEEPSAARRQNSGGGGAGQHRAAPSLPRRRHADVCTPRQWVLTMLTLSPFHDPPLLSTEKWTILVADGASLMAKTKRERAHAAA